MGVAHFVVLSSDLEDVDVSMEGKALARAADALAALAKTRGVPDLWSFHSQDPDDVMDFLEADGFEGELLEGAALPGEQWFEPAAGLETVRDLLEALEKNPAAVDGAEGVEEDLRGVHEILQEAHSRGGRWHFSVDF